MSERVYKVSELKLPVTIEWVWCRDNRGDLLKRATIVERKGRNLLTEDGDWLWWPTVNRYNEVVVLAAAERGTGG